eukprot:765504-Hanusia_phi.AAC.9
MLNDTTHPKKSVLPDGDGEENVAEDEKTEATERVAIQDENRELKNHLDAAPALKTELDVLQNDGQCDGSSRGLRDGDLTQAVVPIEQDLKPTNEQDPKPIPKIHEEDEKLECHDVKNSCHEQGDRETADECGDDKYKHSMQHDGGEAGKMIEAEEIEMGRQKFGEAEAQSQVPVQAATLEQENAGEQAGAGAAAPGDDGRGEVLTAVEVHARSETQADSPGETQINAAEDKRLEEAELEDAAQVESRATAKLQDSYATLKEESTQREHVSQQAQDVDYQTFAEVADPRNGDISHERSLVENIREEAAGKSDDTPHTEPTRTRRSDSLADSRFELGMEDSFAPTDTSLGNLPVNILVDSLCKRSVGELRSQAHRLYRLGVHARSSGQSREDEVESTQDNKQVCSETNSSLKPYKMDSLVN